MDKHSEVLLELNAVETWYGSLRALSNVSLTVSEGSITVILGNNGAGKSTLLNTVLGVLEDQPKNGQIFFQGTRIDRMATERIVRSGISYVICKLTNYLVLMISTVQARRRADQMRITKQTYFGKVLENVEIMIHNAWILSIPPHTHTTRN